MTEAKNSRNQTVTRVYPAVFITASLGGLSFLAFSNGLLLAYFSRLEISSSEILLLLALPSILQFMLVLVFSYLSDRVGKKLIGATGLFCSASAFYLFWQAGFSEGFWRHSFSVVGVFFFGIGMAMSFSNWFAMLHPLIPQQIRGRFFGRLRLTWQGFGFLFSLLVFYLLEQNPGLEVYHWVLGFLVLFLMVRIPIFWSIPEVEKQFFQRVFFSGTGEGSQDPGVSPFLRLLFSFDALYRRLPDDFQSVGKRRSRFFRRPDCPDRKPDGAGRNAGICVGWTNGGPVRNQVCFSMLPFRIQCRSAFGSDPGNTDDFSTLFDGIVNRSFRDDPGGFRNRDDL